MPNPWVSLRRDQLILVYKAVKAKEQLEKGLEEEDKIITKGLEGRLIKITSTFFCI
jgi:preprotein translocase subunit YajC